MIKWPSRRRAGVAVAAVALLALVWQQQRISAGGEAEPAYEFQLRGTVVHVADGDTFTLLVDKRRERIRMASIDAPETTKDKHQPGQPMSQASRKALSNLIAGKQLTLLCYERDRYQRSVCDVPLEDGITANQRQVMGGMAWANMEGRGKFMRDPSLPRFEEKARQARLGLWSQSEQVPPWVWRYQCWKQAQC
ncbi:thermonuclease family protein [Pusillimonas sp.]|uniref:thermonuclease family protein n=1 Tax=Pusillimonas sp. TaxID=3040095 RepID=UPI0037CBC7AD